jgi:membrane-associated phospholipid phosphatase
MAFYKIYRVSTVLAKQAFASGKGFVWSSVHMSLQSTRLGQEVKGIPRECKNLFFSAFRLLRQYRADFLLMGLCITALAGWTVTHDVEWHRSLVAHRTEPLRALARQVSVWGGYDHGVLLICGALWLAGWCTRRRKWQSVALAAFLAASIAGINTNLFRLTLGRPRPSTQVQDGLYGPSFSKEYHSFPSAHATTSFATAAAFAVALPPVGLPALVGAAGVGWARMYMREHYPTDILIGSMIGIFWGGLFGLAVRRSSPRTNESPRMEG